MENNRKYIISIDQSTQGTKALLFDRNGSLMCRADAPHRQIINEKGWVSHDPEEIYKNTCRVIRDVLLKANVSPELVVALGISNQRETSLIWDKTTGKPLADAIVWQCARSAEICERPAIRALERKIFERTGLRLSPYFPAGKLAWLIENTPEAGKMAEEGKLACGTVDAFLVYRLTKGQTFATDFSNASRTQLFDIFKLKWDEEICDAFGIPVNCLPQVQSSDSLFGMTDCEGLFSEPIEIMAVMGDSHAALFGQDCRRPGQAKVTYGTGSSIMMNIGGMPVLSGCGLVTSLAWGIKGRPEYVLEGNLNYTGAVITWLKDDMKMITSSAESEELALKATKNDSLYLVPAFTGLGAPYWDSHAKAAISGMDRTTGRYEIVRAGLECIAYQITDILKAMALDSKKRVDDIKVDGGPTKNQYLMQFQSDIARCRVHVPAAEELSGIGAAYMAGLSCGFWDETIFRHISYTEHQPAMEVSLAQAKYEGWKKAVQKVCS